MYMSDYDYWKTNDWTLDDPRLEKKEDDEDEGEDIIDEIVEEVINKLFDNLKTP